MKKMMMKLAAVAVMAVIGTTTVQAQAVVTDPVQTEAQKKAEAQALKEQKKALKAQEKAQKKPKKSRRLAKKRPRKSRKRWKSAKRPTTLPKRLPVQ